MKAIPRIAESSSKDSIVVYRMGEHVDICQGPLMSNVSQILRFGITAVSTCNFKGLLNL